MSTALPTHSTSLVTVVNHREVIRFSAGSTITITENAETREFVHGLPHFTVAMEGKVMAGFDTLAEAVALCLHNEGWGDYVVREKR